THTDLDTDSRIHRVAPFADSGPPARSASPRLSQVPSRTPQAVAVRIQLWFNFSLTIGPSRLAMQGRRAMDLSTSWCAGDAPQHPRFSRRLALHAGAIGLLGLGVDHLELLRAMAAAAASGVPAPRGADPAPGRDRSSLMPMAPRARSVIYIFLSGACRN